MKILCDTSSIFLLLRIAPEMFLDARCDCVTIKEVYDEIFSTQKFKDKYPWRVSYKSKIKNLPHTSVHTDAYEKYHAIITLSIQSAVINTSTGHCYDPSRVDKCIIAAALALGHRITSGDTGLCQYAEQQFTGIFKGALSALDVINEWLEKKVIAWDDAKQTILVEWIQQKEAPQPGPARIKFKKLTNRPFPQ